MKKQIALLLTLVLMFCMIPCVSAAVPEQAQVVLDAGFAETSVRVTVRLENADRVTNGRLVLRYAPEAGKLLEVNTASGMGAISVNQKTAGQVSVAWVGSAFTQEGAELFTAVFQPTLEQDLHFESFTSDLYAGSTRVYARSDRAFVAWNPFTDIAGHWAEADIIEGWHRGLVAGMTDTTFQPEVRLSRGMFVTMLHRMAGEPEARLSSGFTDVGAGLYYEDAVNWAVEAGITKGMGNNTFRPHKIIERQEMTAMLYRYAKAMDLDLSADSVLEDFVDADELADWAVVPMNWAVSNGVIFGTAEHVLSPEASSTRAQAIAVLCRFLKN